MKKCLCVWSACALLVAASACTKSSPARPSDASVASDAASAVSGTSAAGDLKAAGVTLTTPQPVAPVAGARLKFADQPLTLTVRNAVSTGSSPLTYSFQVATDAGFGSVVFSKDGVAEGSGQTSLKIDKLPGNKDYFWRARAAAGGAAGPFSAARQFNVGPEVVIQAPALIAPANGGTLNGTGSLVAANADRSGPAGQLVYRFDVADSSSFANLVFTTTIAEQGGQTSAQMTANLTANATYFWRVQATDTTNNVSGPFSSVFSFRYVPFDMRQATIVNSPPDLGSWPETAKITSIAFTPNNFQVDFDRRQGPGKWPEVVPPGWSGGLQYTLGMCVNKNDHWYCSGVVQFWDGRSLGDSAPPRDVGREWFYDGRWLPILGYQPSDGETVGLWVGSGNLRDGANFTQASCPRICERSNVALVPWQNDGFNTYTFSLAKTLGLARK